ncbi:MAG: glycoside hydrolase family 97 protein [Dysgonomonas sp.]|nr:glycoside hydrolase family 97 protein [Dysgonomonas sp.]
MKKGIYITTIILCSLINLNVFSQSKITLNSPDGNLQFRFQLKQEAPEYEVWYKKQVLVNSSKLSLDFDNGYFGHNLKINKPKYRFGEETYTLIVGKAKEVYSHYKEVVIPLEEKQKPSRKINLVVRAFNDGIAFRYEFPVQTGWTSFVMYDENNDFNLAGNPGTTALFLPSYLSSHEGLYTKTDYQVLAENELIDMPALFQFPDNIHLAITEAAVRDYAGMYLMKENGILRSKLSPSLKNSKIKVAADLPHQSPWRVFMVSDRVGALIESNILTNLNEPCKIDDTSWIKPGKTTFTWWNGNMVPDTTFMPGNNFETNKYYIDFAARNNIDYHSIYGFAETPWYTDNGFNFGSVGTEVDITKPIATLDMKYICDYAKSKGVGIHVWLNWKALYPKIDEAFAKFEEWGVSGMMVDFMDRDDQEMICIQEEILLKAAKHHLFVQFHGSSKPSGMHRTYPNEFTREGTLNYEVYKWSNEIDADHDIVMPFTRLLAGATDYHLGGFRAIPHSQFKAQFCNPYVTGTRCHMLAMYVVLESYLGMVCDTPTAYQGQPGFEFIQQLPTVWDETIVLNAEVNKYITIARRKGNDWYVGSLNNSRSRTLSIPLNFLGDGNYITDIYTDGVKTEENPNILDKETKIVNKKDSITFKLASAGGTVMRIRKE